MAEPARGARYHRRMVVALVAVFSLAGVVLTVLGVRSLRRRRIAGASGTALAALVFFALAALCATLSLSTMGYRALTHEEIAVVVDTVPIGNQRFRAIFTYPDGEERQFVLLGDELYVDAHILKWKPVANILGLHTSWEFDRVAGRYVLLGDEQSKPRTVMSLARDKPFDMFHLRRSYPFLGPLVDAEYGSGTFGLADEHARFEIRVSTSGLLMRRM